MIPRYTETMITSPGLDASLVGSYREMLIRNGMNIPIVTIDRFGNKTVIQPITTTAHFGVTIFLRETQDTRLDRRTNCEVGVPTKHLTITDWELAREPVFVAEIDLLICTMNHAEFAQHPACGHVYKHALEQAIQELQVGDLFFTMRIYANDPTGVVRKLYTHMLGRTLSFNVTDYPGNAALVTFVFASERNEVHRYPVPLSTVTDEGDGCLEMASGFRLYISSSLDKLERCMEKHAEKGVYSQEELEARLTTLHEKHAAEVVELKEAHKQALLAKDNVIAAKDNTIAQNQRDLIGANAKVAEWEAISVAQQQQFKVKESEEKARQANLATRSEELKYASVIWKTVGATVIAVGTWLVKDWIDRQKEDS